MLQSVIACASYSSLDPPPPPTLLTVQFTKPATRSFKGLPDTIPLEWHVVVNGGNGWTAGKLRSPWLCELRCNSTTPLSASLSLSKFYLQVLSQAQCVIFLQSTNQVVLISYSMFMDHSQREYSYSYLFINCRHRTVMQKIKMTR